MARTRTTPRRGAVCALLLALLLAAPGELVASDGDLDPSFGAGGIVTTAIGVSAFAYAVVVQADGKLVAAGGTRNGSTINFALARYNADGSLDSTFGTGGTVTTGIAGFARALAVQADGKLVAAGQNDSTGAFALARYNADGSLDPSFGTGGTVATPVGLANALAVQADGKLVAAGVTFNGSAQSFALVRYNADGSLDPSFGTGGVTTAIAVSTIAYAVAVQADGKLVAAGPANLPAAFAIARYNADGSLDPSFGGGGTVATTFGPQGSANAVRVQADGKLAVAGGLGYSLGPHGSLDNFKFTLARYNADGNLDPGFGTGGTVAGMIPGSAVALAVQVDGKLVAAGGDSVLARYYADGSLDPSFGTGGTVTTGVSGAAFALAVQADGKLVAAGDNYSTSSTTAVFALARYESRTCATLAACRVSLKTTLPKPARVRGKRSKETARKLQRLRAKTGRALAQQRYRKAREALVALLAAAQGAEVAGTLGVPLGPLQAAVTALLARIPPA